MCFVYLMLLVVNIGEIINYLRSNCEKYCLICLQPIIFINLLFFFYFSYFVGINI